MNPSDRRQALADAKLYLVADGDFPNDVLGIVVEAGVDLVQLRMKDADVSEILEIGDAWMHVCRDANVPLIINDRPDIAFALGADGVHLGQDDLPPSFARRIVGDDMIIGRSTHSREQIAQGVAEHDEGCADYIAVGPIWETPTGPGKPGVGLELITHASQNVSLPWFGIGGIDTSNVGDVAGAGATRIVVVRAITQADDPVAAVQALRAGIG
jgi:thiamine-phosphate pyrophosphorylase